MAVPRQEAKDVYQRVVVLLLGIRVLLVLPAPVLGAMLRRLVDDDHDVVGPDDALRNDLLIKIKSRIRARGSVA